MCGLDGRVASFWRCIYIYIISIYIYTYVYYDLKGIRVKWYEMMWWNDLKAIDLWQGNHWPPEWMFVSRRTEHKRWLHRWISSLPSLLTQVRRFGHLLWLSFDDGLRCLRCGGNHSFHQESYGEKLKNFGNDTKNQATTFTNFKVFGFFQMKSLLVEEKYACAPARIRQLSGILPSMGSFSAHFKTRVNLKSIDFVSTGINSLV